MEHEPGVCNIGPAEIARRLRVGYTSTAVTLGLLAAMRLLRAPPLWRLCLAWPASIAAAGYLQAHSRFCLAFGLRGVYNFGELGAAEKVILAEERARDRKKALQLSLQSGGVGVTVALLATVAAALQSRRGKRR